MFKTGESISAHRFTGRPPLEPEVLFTEDGLLALGVWGWLGASIVSEAFHGPPTHLVGHWTVEGNVTTALARDKNGVSTDWQAGHVMPVYEKIREALPGSCIRWHDIDTARDWIWVLTDTTLHEENSMPPLSWRLGRFPD